MTKSDSYRKVYRRRRFWLKARTKRTETIKQLQPHRILQIQSASVSDRSPAVSNTNGVRRPSVAAEAAPSGQTDRTNPEINAQHVAQGMGLGIMERRERVTNESVSLRDTASVVSLRAMPGAMSLIMSGSAFSSPRAAHAVPDTQGGSFKVPSMPTAKSWADVTRSRRKADPMPVPVA